jgi:hypothetical protein
MHPKKIVNARGAATAPRRFSTFFEKALVSRVNRRMLIRMARILPLDQARRDKSRIRVTCNHGTPLAARNLLRMYESLGGTSATTTGTRLLIGLFLEIFYSLHGANPDMV